MRQLTFEDFFAPTVRGKKFCFTGGLSGMTRITASNLVRELGGTVSNHVCKSTDYLVVAGGSLTGGSRKLRDATRLGIKTITEAEFLAMV